MHLILKSLEHIYNKKHADMMWQEESKFNGVEC